MSQRPRNLMEPDPDLPDWKLPSLKSVLWTIAVVFFLALVLTHFPN